MSYFSNIAVSYLVLIFALQLTLRHVVVRWRHWIFLIAIVMVLVMGGYLSWYIYHSWQTGDVEKFLLPPHQPITYFLKYSFMLFFSQYVVSFLISLVALGATLFLNKKYEGRFFESEEPFLFATGLLLAGHPGWIIFLVALLLSTIVFSLTQLKKDTRTSLYFLWMPAAVASIVLNDGLIQSIPWLNALIINGSAFK